jgi:hypothetical protein
MNKNTRTGGELIQDFLETYDIPFVFGNPGTTETTFLAAVAASKATYILSLRADHRFYQSESRSQGKSLRRRLKCPRRGPHARANCQKPRAKYAV